jgi:hypothetical protein
LPAEPAEKNTHGTDYYQVVTTSQEAVASRNDENQRCRIEDTLQNHTALGPGTQQARHRQDAVVFAHGGGPSSQAVLGDFILDIGYDFCYNNSFVRWG